MAFGINDSGQIVGSHEFFSVLTHGFLDTGGSFTTIDVPGSNLTSASGVNGNGQIVGIYVGSSGGTSHAFLATPTVVPEPRTLSVLAGGLLSLCVMARRRREA